MKNVSTISVNDDNKMVNVSVSVVFFQPEGESFVVAECPSLQLRTYGKNLAEAKKMFEEAFALWKKTVDEKFDISEVLKSLGWKLTRKKIFPANLLQHPISVPVHLLETDTKQFPIPVSA